MVEAVVNVAVEQLILAAAGWLQQEISLLKGVKPKLENMKDKMQIFQTIAEDAENQSVKRKSVKLWLEKLQEVSYDMDDVLDEWSTRVEILEREEAEEKMENMVMAVSCFSSKKLNCFSAVKQLPWRREIALKVNDINESINSVFLEMKDFELAKKVVGNDGRDKRLISNDTFRTTTSSIDESKVFGRGDDKGFLLRKVLSVNTEHQKSLQVISIVGAGGLGKTTLAQMIYNDEKVKEKFGENRIWVCVSNPFDEVKVARAILEGLQVDHTKFSYLQTLHQSIEKSISKLKFLLVLDDVWDEDSWKWDRLSICLKFGDPNCRIIVTTRKEEVVRTMGTLQSNILKLGLISDSDCWLLMKQVALQGKTNRENNELEDIGKEIAKKCNGLPLAAKTLGGLLISKDYVQEWREVLNSEIWELEKAEIDLFPHIFLSYQELSSVLKRCFLILAFFPKDSRLDIEVVIQLWMSYGYLDPKIGQGDMVETGKKYLKVLVSRAFLEGKEQKNDEKIVVSMHDIMYDFALYLLGDETLKIIVDNNTENASTTESTSKRGPISTKVRHLIINGNISQTPIGFDLGKLRTCILQWVPPNVTWDLVERLKMVRLLNLENCYLKQLPGSITNLINLRMLVLNDNPLVELPETIGDLFKLQHLSFEGIWFSSLPQSLGNLVNLISLTPCYLALKKAPESVAKLINLQNLGRVHIGAGESHLGLLKDLNQLRGVLKIEFESDYGDEVDAKNAAIGSKTHLTGFALYFNDYNVTDGVVAALQPPPNVQTLEIFGLLPSWITFLYHLKDLHIQNEHISTLPPLWKLELLEKIVISECYSLKTIGREFLGIDSSPNKNFSAFPKLVELIFSECVSLTKFEDLKQEDKGEITVMPNLKILNFRGCYMLGEIPIRLLRQASSLKELYIGYQWLSFGLNVEVIDEGVGDKCSLSPFGEMTPFSKLEMSVKCSRQVPISKITHRYITLIDLCFLLKISYLPPMGTLPHLESLTIKCCENVKFIGREFLGIDDEEFVVFPDLVSLKISMCPFLEEWEDLKPEDEGKITVMPKLENLEITKCPKFQVMPARLLSQLSSLKVLHLPRDDRLQGE